MITSVCKVCTACKQEKGLELFALKKTGAHGRRAQCRACVNLQKVDYKKRVKEKVAALQQANKLNPTQMKSCGLGGWTGPRVREPGEAPGQLISKMTGVYIPADQCQRNDGLKHIKSRGVLC